MSAHSESLREQASKCNAHARAITDSRTQEELRKLAAEYIEKAAMIEGKSKTD